ncbi:MAG: GNAT family N-acetyltransferase [Gemmatimonadaceae bacterium]
MSPDSSPPAKARGRVASRVVVRPLVQEDRSAVLSIVTRAGNFSAEEIAVAMELVDEWLTDGEASGYLTLVLEDLDRPEHPVRGYVCVGPTPLTDGTFDLYWIAVDPEDQGRGFGQRLLAAAEDVVRGRGGRLLLIETASHDAYSATVRFYERAGYPLVARIEDYYRPGEDKLVFGKRLGPQPLRR